ncbi:hypothetical protein C7B69_03415 [filamentous cyanobacterium Phorm 46]|nr:hypothetical protein C7B69_03415 [filamentous cyanobacterium Phorm 46]PSB52608.1 hypothetical protein C7B67_06430 [filamentous cyanobacterium Phorm 6]
MRSPVLIFKLAIELPTFLCNIPIMSQNWMLRGINQFWILDFRFSIEELTPPINPEAATKLLDCQQLTANS